MALENPGIRQGMINGETVALTQWRLVMQDTDADYNVKFTTGPTVIGLGVVAAGESAAVGGPVTIDAIAGGAILKMTAGGAITVGSAVAPAVSGYIVAVNGDHTYTKIGQALQAATASGDIIPVWCYGAQAPNDFGADIGSTEIANLAVTNAKLATAAVTSAKIATANVTNAKLGASSVTSAKIAAANVTTAKIKDSAITTSKIASSNVTPVKCKAITSKMAISDVIVFSSPAGTQSGVILNSGSIPFAFRVTQVAIRCNATSAGGTFAIRKDTNLLTNAVPCAAANSYIVASALIPTYEHFTTSDTLQYVKAAADNAGVAFIFIARE